MAMSRNLILRISRHRCSRGGIYWKFDSCGERIVIRRIVDCAGTLVGVRHEVAHADAIRDVDGVDAQTLPRLCTAEGVICIE